ncbi:hypothetical protein TNCT_401661 [Trichonephila clavata]|uniref:Uncharacterized protein n=1 Tax=Trichonephila clavata TaxID=2740835 RepID=A0A8X6L4K0_TRICU|nr:hypothetical protein TNCT_401661 [Trichonephila clavata]
MLSSSHSGSSAYQKRPIGHSCKHLAFDQSRGTFRPFGLSLFQPQTNHSLYRMRLASSASYPKANCGGNHQLDLSFVPIPA